MILLSSSQLRQFCGSLYISVREAEQVIITSSIVPHVSKIILKASKQQQGKIQFQN